MKYNDETKNKLSEVIGLRLTAKLACHVAGINEKTFYDWMKEHDDFKQAIESAKELREFTLLNDVLKGGDTKDKISLLKMLYPSKYNQSNLKLSGDSQNPIAIKSNLGIDKERLAELIEQGYTPKEILENL